MVEYSKAVMVPNPLTPCQAIHLDAAICNGCNMCVGVCRSGVMVPNIQKGEVPVVLYPDECVFCGCCVDHCPKPGAIRMEHPLNQRIGWKRKDTGQWFRIGMKNPPPPITKPPVS